MISSKQLKEKYFAFFESKGHKRIPSASLVPENDPTVLFTTAGMHPLVPYLLGESHPCGRRLVNVQKCVRTCDIDSVGDSFHLTFFEMLGNWSLGDYFKKESIPWSWEFLTSKEWLALDPEKLYVTVFKGDNFVKKDSESIELWKSCFEKSGIAAKEGERIFLLGAEDNWWGPVGKTGPCGPDTEIFFASGKKHCSKNCQPGCSCGKYVEIWNNVFMEYNKKQDGFLEPLSRKNVDTGMGVERVVASICGFDSVFESDTIKPLIEILENEFNNSSQEAKTEARIVADHIRCAVMMISDGVLPSNKDQGYVLRRLLRRSARYLVKNTKNSTAILKDIILKSSKILQEEYQEAKDSKRIINVVCEEEGKFIRTLQQGIKKFNETAKSSRGVLSGKDAFDLFQSYGFPIEMTIEMAHEKNISVDKKGFLKEMSSHKELSRSASEGKFKGGLADNSYQTAKYHTAAHLMLAGLRKVLGSHVQQKGSNITSERIRFDFSHPEKLTNEQIFQVEDFVNKAIAEDYKVAREELSVKEAKEKGAVGVFDSKYGDMVKVYKIGDVSNEICGGPHAERTGCLGKFKIIKEESSSAGVRRIKAVLE